MSIAKTVDIFIFRLFPNLESASVSVAFSSSVLIESMTIIRTNQ